MLRRSAQQCRLQRDATATVDQQGKEKVQIRIDAAQYDRLAASGSALISFETPNDEVQALFVPDFEKTK